MAVTWLCVLAGLDLAAGPATAFEVKRTTGGAPVHWAAGSVAFVVDKELLDVSAQAAGALAEAALGWSGAAGAPTLSTTVGRVSDAPAVDGTNSIIYAEDGYAPAGNALAVTLVSYDDTTGEIIDTDIVINGKHKFAVLDPAARSPSGAHAVSTEGATGAEGEGDVFDLQHVAAHEMGHALGLGDEPSVTAAIMYPYTLPDDASVRAPLTDDLDGIVSLYHDSPSAGAKGCGGSSVAGAPIGMRNASVALAAIAAAIAWIAARRRARAIIPFVVACLALASGDGAARSPPPRASSTGRSTARLGGVSTRQVHGVFQSLLGLAPVLRARPAWHDVGGAAAESAPLAPLEAPLWGGTFGGITQQVRGPSGAPQGDELALARPTDGTRAGAVLAAIRSPLISQ